MTTGIVLTRPLSSAPTTGTVSTSVINGQTMPTFPDPQRASKVLSIAEQNHIFSRNRLSDQDWIRVGGAADAASGYVAEFDGTIVYASGHCEDSGAASKDIHVFINGVDQGSIGTLTGGADVNFTNVTLNLDFLQGDLIRLQAVDTPASAAGNIQDTIIKLTTKHRLV